MKLSFSRKRQEDELNQLMVELGPGLYQHMMRMVKDSAEAEDLVQEAFVRAWDKWDSFRGDSKRSTWVYSIATNLALQHLRKHKGQHEDSEQLAVLPADTVVLPAGTELQQAVEQAIEALPERQKAIFCLRYYEEMPYEDISTAVGGSQGSLKASYHHARKKVEQFLTARLNLS